MDNPRTPPASEPIPEVAVMKRLNERLGSVTSPLMEGDNLAILLCGIYDNPDQENEDDTGWTPDAVAGCDEVLAAIRAHYAPAAALLSAQAVMLEEARKAMRDIKPYLEWTVSDESPGHHPTMPSAVGAFLDAFAKLEASHVG